MFRPEGAQISISHEYFLVASVFVSETSIVDGKTACHISLTSSGHTAAAKSEDWTPWICCCLVNLITRMN